MDHDDIKANTLVWVKLNRKKQMAIVVSRRLHTVEVRRYHPGHNRFEDHMETVSLRIIERAQISKDEYQQIACGKKILSKNRALQLVSINFIFTDVAKRKERRVYYCTRCRGFHTTSVRWLPKEIRVKLREHPFSVYLEKSGKQGRYTMSAYSWQGALHRWLRDEIGLRISRRTFRKTLRRFNRDEVQAIKTLLNTPAEYIEFVLYEIFGYRNSHNDLYAIDV